MASSSSDSVSEVGHKEEFPRELLETVESVLDYKFKNKNLLEAALTHPSISDAESYLRLKFLGGAALRLAFSNFQYLRYSDIDPVELERLRELNLSTEKLACLAVRYGLYRCVCHNSPRLFGKWVDKFISEVEMHDQKVPYRGVGIVKAPQVLADIVEALAGAIYVDDELKLSTVWVVISGLLEPLVTLDMLDQIPQPATTYFEANGCGIPDEREDCPELARIPLLEMRKALGPAGGLSALLAKKRKVSATDPVARPASVMVPSVTPPPARCSTRGKSEKAADELESELEQMKARVEKLEAELSIAREATRAAEAATKTKEEKLAREMATREIEIENAWQVAQYQALDAYGDEIVGVVNQHYFDCHVRALTLAEVAPRDPRWYNVEFPFEGITPKLTFPWEAEGVSNGKPNSPPSVDIPE